MTPDEGRAAWRAMLDRITEDAPFSRVLHHLIEGVMIDIIEKRIQLSDTFAVTIGKRIAFLTDAIAEEQAD